MLRHHLISPLVDLKCPGCRYTTRLGPGTPWTEWFVCRGCRGLVSASLQPFRYEKPDCPECRTPLSVRDYALYESEPQLKVPCPQCKATMTVLPTSILHGDMERVNPPSIGAQVHGVLMPNGAFHFPWFPQATLLYPRGKKPKRGYVEGRVHEVIDPTSQLPHVFVVFERELAESDF